MEFWNHRITEAKGQYRLTIPRALVKALGWEKGDVVRVNKMGRDLVVLELVGKGVKFEGDISERQNGADRPAERSGKVGDSVGRYRKPG